MSDETIQTDAFDAAVATAREARVNAADDPDVIAEYAAIGADVDQRGAAYDEALEPFLAAGRCSQGHTNPASAAFCSTCGEELPELDPAVIDEFKARRDSFAQARTLHKKLGEWHGLRGVGPVVVDNTEDGAE